MGKSCKTATGLRDWTKEEMMAYLDWDKKEEERIEAQVAQEMKDNPISRRRGTADIWRAIKRDSEQQQAAYEAGSL